MTLHNLLKTDCLSFDSIAYSVCCCLWILSYHDFAWPYFSDFQLNIIELVTKVLDYFNKEKVVRVVCFLFEVRIFA